MGANLPPSHPRVTAAAQAAMIRANLFPYMGVSECSGNAHLGSTGGTKFRAASTRYILLPMEVPGCRRERASVLLGLPRLHRLLARQLLGARPLQDVSALLRADPQGELGRRVAVPAHHVDVGAVPEQQVDHLRVAARGGVHERRVAVLGDEVGIEVLGEDLLGVDEVALLDGVEQHLDAFGALFPRLFLKARGEQVDHVVDDREADHGGHGDEQGQGRYAQVFGHLSENADYLYWKKRLREIERRIRFLMKRLEIAEVVDPRDQGEERVFFGATVAYRDARRAEHTVSIVGTDEVDPGRGRVSWVSPIARALLKAREGDAVTLKTPVGDERLEVLAIRYEELK